METTVSIRKINTQDVRIIHDLAKQIWPKAFETILSKKQISYMMNLMYSMDALQKDAARGVEFYVLNFNGNDCGYAAIENINNETYKLHKIYLSQKLHGKGLGKYLLQQVEAIVKNYGAGVVQLNVNRNNSAVNFYKSQGYAIIKQEDIDIGMSYFMNDYVMAKNLIG